MRRPKRLFRVTFFGVADVIIQARSVGNAVCLARRQIGMHAHRSTLDGGWEHVSVALLR